MSSPNFCQISKRRKIDSEEIFEIPKKIDYFRYKGAVRPTHLMVSNHSWAFAWTSDPVFKNKFYKSKNRKRRFFPIPEQALKGQLFEVKLSENPFETEYGQPRWFSTKEISE